MAEAKREIIADDDEAAMKALAHAMKARRGNEKEKKIEKKEKEKGFALDDTAGKENNLFQSDVKILKKTPKKVMSDLSQIYNRKKKKAAPNQSSTALGYIKPPAA